MLRSQLSAVVVFPHRLAISSSPPYAAAAATSSSTSRFTSTVSRHLRRWLP